ncbi:hypothetical protein M422DRAFT_248776 [Sphaerobolus stellatus SS14]|nr:hypothetical protein M422DRAFT_248776 [Sphaerobolus stellatus SS14]
MDIFSTITNTIDLASMIKRYIDDVKGGKEHRNRLRDGLMALQFLLPLLAKCLQSALDAAAMLSKNIEELQGIFGLYKDILTKIEKKLTKAERKQQKFLWPFDKGDIMGKIEKLKRLASWIHIALDVGIGDMIEHIHEDVHLYINTKL